MTGDLDLNSNQIKNLTDGTLPNDAATVAQITTAVAITGGTINGTSVGATTASTGRFTALEVTNTSIFTGLGAFNGTGALKIPVGTTVQRPTPATGMIRYDSTLNEFQGYYASSWGSIGGVAAGSNTQVQYNNSGVLAGSSAFTFNGTTLTIPKIEFASSNTPSLTNYQGGAITSGTTVASTSGTSIDFTSIPSWVKRITVMFNGVSTNGTSNVQIQIGNGSFVTSGYASIASGFGGASSTTLNFSSGIVTGDSGTAAMNRHGNVYLTTLGSNVWTVTGSFALPAIGQHLFSGGLTLAGALDRIRITTINGTDSFDAGSINILYE
jgi:hypothetical protein